MTRALYFLPVIVFAGLASWFGLGLNRDPSILPSTLIDRPVPAFALAPIEGRDRGLSSADLVGEPSLLNVWGSWCAGCEIEHPLLMEIAASGIPIYGIDWKDKEGAGAAFLAKRGDPFRAIGDDSDGRVAIDLGVTGAPETFVVDRKGRIRHKHVGALTREDWERTIRPLLKELARAP